MQLEGDDEEELAATEMRLIAQGINAKRLQDAGIYNCNGLMMQTKKSRLTGMKWLSKAKVDNICEAAEKVIVNFGYMTGTDVLLPRQSVVKITTGSHAVDELLGGGIETSSITEAFGEFRSGKTQLAHTLCVSTQLPISMQGGHGKVAYIDIEGTEPDGLAPIAEWFGLDSGAILDNMRWVVKNSTGNQAFDKILDGGIKTSSIMEGFGEFKCTQRINLVMLHSLHARSRKTQLLHTHTVSIKIMDFSERAKLAEHMYRHTSKRRRSSGGNHPSRTKTAKASGSVGSSISNELILQARKGTPLQIIVRLAEIGARPVHPSPLFFAHYDDSSHVFHVQTGKWYEIFMPTPSDKRQFMSSAPSTLIAICEGIKRGHKTRWMEIALDPLDPCWISVKNIVPNMDITDCLVAVVGTSLVITRRRMNHSLVFDLENTDREPKKVLRHPTFEKDFYMCVLPAGKSLFTLSFPGNSFSALNLELGEWSPPHLLQPENNFVFTMVGIYGGCLIVLREPKSIEMRNQRELWRIKLEEGLPAMTHGKFLSSVPRQAFEGYDGQVMGRMVRMLDDFIFLHYNQNLHYYNMLTGIWSDSGYFALGSSRPPISVYKTVFDPNKWDMSFEQAVEN